jgi:hypothetical protein
MFGSDKKKNGSPRPAVQVDTLIGCNRAAMGDALCADQFIERFGLKAYRRPLSAEEKARYVGLYTSYTASDGFAVGIRMVVETMLQSPHFLYHVEFNSPTLGTPNDVLPLGPYEMAARLSYFAWGSMPDDALFAAAKAGGLADTASVQGQAERLFSDSRATDTFGSFHLQWLGMESADLSKDAARFPAFTPALFRPCATRRSVSRTTCSGGETESSKRCSPLPSSILTGPLIDLRRPAIGSGG